MRRSTRSLALLASSVLALLLLGGGDGASGAVNCAGAPEGATLELVYRLRAGEEGVTRSSREEAAEVVCKRLRALGVVNGEVGVLGKGRLRVRLPHRGDAESERAIELLGAPGRLFFYDWEPNLLGRERRIGGHPGASAPRTPLRRAEGEWRAAGRDIDDPANKRLIRSGAFATARRAARLASKTGVDAVLVSEQPTDRLGRVDLKAPPGWYVLRDDPALSGSDIVEPKQEINELGLPNVTFSFTEEGRAAFEQVTRSIAHRGLARIKGVVSEREAERLSGQFAVVFDGVVMTRPIVNCAQNPDGIDGRTGAQISGGFASLQAARDMATILRIGALPIDLALARQRILRAQNS